MEPRWSNGPRWSQDGAKMEPRRTKMELAILMNGISIPVQQQMHFLGGEDKCLATGWSRVDGTWMKKWWKLRPMFGAREKESTRRRHDDEQQQAIKNDKRRASRASKDTPDGNWIKIHRALCLICHDVCWDYKPLNLQASKPPNRLGGCREAQTI